MAGRQWLAVLAAALIGGGAATLVASCGEDDGDVQIEGSSTGSTGTTGTGPRDGHRLGDRGHQRHQRRGPRRGDVQGHGLRARPDGRPRGRHRRAPEGGGRGLGAARQAAPTPPGRPYYERIEPLVALFPELDGKIDAREDDFPKKAKDPTWTGFHPIERALWHDGRITAAHPRAGGRAGHRLATPRRADGRREGHPRGGDPRHGRAGGRDRGVEDHGRGGALLQARPAHLRRQPRGRARVLRRARPARAGQGRRRWRTRSTTRSRPPSTRWASCAREAASRPTTS